jgi:hypothetical protein
VHARQSIATLHLLLLLLLQYFDKQIEIGKRQS